MSNGLRWILISGLLFLSLCVSARAAAPRPPAIHAAAAILIDAGTGQVLYAHNPDRRLAPASTTKILTGLLLARSIPPEQQISTSPAAAATPGNALHMRPGERFTAHDLLYAILLVSANDASVAAAEHIAGTEVRFVDRMNSEAQRLGATNTHFANPHGLPAPDHYSTARDLAAIAREAMTDPSFAAAVRTRTYRVPRDNGRPSTLLTNSNDLLWSMPGMEGIKTGYTGVSGYCFVGSAMRNDRRLISVVLNSPDWRGETAALLNYGFARSSGSTPAQAAPPTASKGGHPLPQNSDDLLPQNRGVRATPTAATTSSASNSPQEDPAGSPPVTTAAQGSTKPFGPRNSGQAVALAGSGPVNVGSGKPLPGRRPTGTAAVRGASLHPALGALGPQGGRVGLASDPMGAKRGASAPASRSAGLPDGGIRSAAVPSLTSETEGGRMGASGRNPTLAAKDEAKAFSHPAPLIIHPSSRREGRGGVSWILLLLFLMLFCLLLWWLTRYGEFNLKLNSLALSAWRRRDQEAKPSRMGSSYEVPQAQQCNTAPPEKPIFTFVAPTLVRREGRAWLDNILETPHRLLEPAIRRQARALLDADPAICADKVLPLLSAAGHKLRVVAADLLASHAPRRAEEMLLAVLEDEQTPPDVRAEAIQHLAQQGGDRFERQWVQMLLREGSPPAAHALAMLPRLDETTGQALRHVIQMPHVDTRDNDRILKQNLRNGQIACVLGAHGALAADEAQPLLQALPANHRDQVIVSVLRGVSSPWAIERLMETFLNGHAYPALQALLECDPTLVGAALDARWEQLDVAERTRGTILKWLIKGEGDPQALQKLAEAGNDLASGALQLGRTQRWDPAQASPDALLAAAQIMSLRLGYSLHAQDQIVHAFRKAATGEEPGALLTDEPELQPLAQAYTNSEVYDAVQVAMHTDDGLTALMTCLVRQHTNLQYQEEMAFWCDKTPRETRLLLTSALVAAESQTARAAVAARAVDPCGVVRAAALRSLHARPYIPEPVSPSDPVSNNQLSPEPAEEPPISVVDQAA